MSFMGGVPRPPTRKPCDDEAYRDRLQKVFDKMDIKYSGMRDIHKMHRVHIQILAQDIDLTKIKNWQENPNAVTFIRWKPRSIPRRCAVCTEVKEPSILAIRSRMTEFDYSKHPVSGVQWVPVDQVEPNDYNPNSVAGKEMKLLHTSIKHDGYTQPIVTIWDWEKKKFIIVDGFHRYFICKNHKDIRDSTNGCVPIVVLEKGMNDRMASTVRHNRARGSTVSLACRTWFSRCLRRDGMMRIFAITSAWNRRSFSDSSI